ncbi:MAG: alcohol dehydrogenase [Acidobacteria bacterium]|nr:MAG: alcohol dehydrogenase [Acidobacteriota bacterium]
MARIPNTYLDVFPLCLGGNVFGWTANEQQSFDVLDAYAAAGGNFIDTADVYSAWVPGHSGGESETIIGRWMATRGTRNDMVIATKVGMAPGLKGLSATTIRAAAEASLRRLEIDRIDMYYAHADDPDTPLTESLHAFDAVLREGKVRYIAASNYTAPRLAEALAVSSREGLARYIALQPHYNLVHRSDYEGELRDLSTREGLACFPYYGLAKGFLTGKYRPHTRIDSPRAASASAYLDEHGLRLLATLDDIAAAHHATVAAVSLAWLMAQPNVVAPIASARSVEQLAELLPAASLSLSPEDLVRLNTD